MKVLVVYYSRSGTTKKMAEIIAKAISRQRCYVDIYSVEEISADRLCGYDGIIAGSPTYYGDMAWQLKQLFDESVKFHGRLDGKIGGAFTSSANVAGGNETTVLSILQVMLIHGMVVQGDFQGDHYGPAALGKIDQRVEKNCQRFAERFVSWLKKVAGVSK